MSGSYKKQSEIISICNTNPNDILVNNEWTFKVPEGFEYFIESEFDDGIQGGADLSGSVKPLVIKGLKQGTDYLFNFALQKHYDFFGNYGTIIDCKYDNRVADENSGASQKIIIDKDNLFVDIMAVNTWPFGIDLQIRIRGTSIEAFDFSAMAKGLDEMAFSKVSDAMKEIAESISLKSSVKSSSTTKTQATKSTKKTTPKPNDPNCIIDGTVLKKYIGSNADVVLPDGLTEIADNTFSGRNIRSIVVPKGVKTIGRSVFENCFELEEAVLPSTLKELGEYSFVDCHKLKSVTLGNNLSSIEGSLFSECYELANVIIPKKVKSIDAFAFKNCRQFTSIVIPDGVQSIGFTSFSNCINLEYLYIPSSVTGIYDNFMGDTPFDGCSKLVIHCPSGSTAEEYCKSHNINYVIDESPKKISAPKKSSTKKDKSVDDVAGLVDTMSNLNAQVTDMQKQELSDEDREALNNIMGTLGDMMDDLHAGQATMDKFGDYLEQKEAREKAEEEEKARKKAEAVAAGKSEKDIVNMYIILTNEKKLGKLRRSQKDFYETYEDDFVALSKAEVIKTRKEMLEAMKDEALCSYYAESFKQRSVEDRFSVSTRNLNNVSTEPELGVKADWAVENSKEWYQPSEYDEVRRLMDADLVETRKSLDEQLRPLDEAWLKFSTGKDFLKIEISDKAVDGSDLQPQYSNFQVVIGDQLVAVRIATKGIFQIGTIVMNCFTWYWGVTVRDIWEAALANEVDDKREGAYNGSQLANQAIGQIRSEHPETKVASDTTSISSYSKPATSSHTAPASTTQRSTTSTSTQQASSQPAKKEGCYIATAVYGSYDAPEVMALRHYRDETLRNTAFGRWFIRTYYRLSPPVAEKLKNAKHLNRFVRSILDKWVEKLNRKQQ